MHSGNSKHYILRNKPKEIIKMAYQGDPFLGLSNQK
jgi:hypothetical protein